MVNTRSCFCDEAWTSTIDDCFISCLEYFATQYERIIKVHDSWMLNECLVKINERLGKEHKWGELVAIFGPDDARTRRWAIQGPVSPRKIQSAEKTVHDYGRALKERDLFKKLGNIIPKTIPPANGLAPPGQFCPYYHRSMLTHSPHFFRGDSSQNQQLNDNPKAKRLLDF